MIPARKNVNEAGFTLIEVLAALLVFSVAIIGLTRAGAESARAVSAIDDKMLASIVADNQLVLARQSFPKPGVVTGSEETMSRRFNYEVETARTETQGLYRMVVKVRANDRAQVLIERTAFKSFGAK